MNCRAVTLASMLVGTALLPSTAEAALVFSNWIAGSGNWNLAANWDPAVVPNNGTGGNTYSVTINGAAGTIVSLNINATIVDLTVGANNTLTIPDNPDLAVGNPVVNNGLISMNSAANLTDLLITSNPTNLTGSGTLAMSAHSNNRIQGSTDFQLVNGANHTIRGSGQIGLNLINLMNAGLVQADQSAVPLIIDLRGVGALNQNQGIYQATAGATLRIASSAINNAGGLLRAQAGSIVELSGSTIAGGELTTAGDGQIRLVAANTLENITNTGHIFSIDNADPTIVGVLDNQGSLTLNSTGNLSDLFIGSNPTTFNGGGELVMGPHFNSRIVGVTSGVLVNGASHTIRGSGQFGLNLINLVNNGLIEADNSATSLQLDLRDTVDDNANNNLMKASSGATLTLLATNLDNTNGLLAADDASIVNLNGSHIRGGELSSAGSGVVRLTNANTLENITNTGHIFSIDNADPTIVGVLDNQGSLTLNSTGNLSDLFIGSNPTTFNGGGELVMGPHSNTRIVGVTGAVLVNGADHTIRGAGQFGLNLINLVNNGLIQADNPATGLQFDLRDTVNQSANHNLMEATNGATLTLLATNLDNTNGVINADDASFVTLTGSHIRGGTLTSVGTGLVRLTGSNTLENVTNSANILNIDSADPTIVGTLTNHGVFTLNSTGNLTDLSIGSNPTTLAGNGQLVMGPHSNSRLQGITDGLLINAAGHTIRGGGQIGFNLIDINNQGNIIAEAATAMTIDQRTFFNNQGLLSVTGVGSMSILAGAFANAGQVQIDATRTLSRTGNFVQTAGATTVNGTLSVSSGSVQLQGGTLKGNGQVTSAVSNTGGIIDPGNSTGHLHIQGTLATSSVIRAEITSGKDHDLLTISGNASLAGALSAAFDVNNPPAPGTVATVLTANVITGTFNTVKGCRGIKVVYSPNSVTVQFTGVVRPGDVNCDGLVNVVDLLAVIQAWGNCPASQPLEACGADVAPAPNGDGVVNVGDLLMIISNWG